MTSPFDPIAGASTLAELQDAETTEGWRATATAAAPGLDDWIAGAVFGGTYQRPALTIRDRQLLNLAAIAALGGADPQLVGHIRTCKRIGMTSEEISEAVVHLIPYIGLPRAMAALRMVNTAASDGSSER
ncbi:carboxymuconolactone decarboxylase family protein [Arthrobacter sp. 24S4-2]|uniref:carboxymuconolactone decarboxylase family protein n=1 Tax=Arthrobacter sp. 24S4-2 TaxID=2575374 RepID=UPI0010C77E10|nr:carboxymuconolactone decarboxylase family protein [Arthrobacter sp. 24S4-2]QCO96987.1 carboxymuconolactone decarboxylase family protein [Arthrobacter sp. 24S4-2]